MSTTAAERASTNGGASAHDRISVPIPESYGISEARFYARIEGVTALLMHKPSMEAGDGTAKRSGKNIPTPADEAEAGAYRAPDGSLYLPAISVQRAMIGAGKHFKDPNYSRGTLAGPLAAALSPPTEEGFPLGASEYVIDTRRAVLKQGSSKVAVMRSRARIDLPWAADVSMGFDASTMAPELLAQVLAMAGQKVGVLDFRPELKGPYGRFAVTSFEVEA